MRYRYTPERFGAGHLSFWRICVPYAVQIYARTVKETASVLDGEDAEVAQAAGMEQGFGGDALALDFELLHGFAGAGKLEFTLPQIRHHLAETVSS